MSNIPVHQRGYTNPQLLAETGWLAENLDNPNVRIVDARPPQQYGAGHIPGAVLGYENARSYAAGFSQWSRQPDTPVES